MEPAPGPPSSAAVPAARQATRADVALRSGVSAAVVSYVLNDGPRPVAPQTRDRVLQAVRDLGYRPNAMARALRRGRMDAVGLVVPDIGNPYFAEFAREVTTRAADRQHAVLLSDASNDPEREHQHVQSLIQRQVDGILLISLRPHEQIAALREEATPIVIVDQVDESDPTRSVVIDNDGGARTAVQHLLDHGHRRVAFIGGPAGMPGADARRSGWREALGGPEDSSLVYEAPFSRRGGHAAARSLLAGPDRPTAVFVSSDVQAIGALSACSELGVRVPEDLAVISFDGTEESEFASPPLTVMRQPIGEIAEAALRSLLDGDELPPHTTIASELVVRRSCGCI